MRALEYARWQQQQAQQGYAPDLAPQQPAHPQTTGYPQPGPGQAIHGYDLQPPQAGYDPHVGHAPQGHGGASQYGYAQPQQGYAEPAPAAQPHNPLAPQFERFAPGPQAAPDPYSRYAPAAPPAGYPTANPHDPHALAVPHDTRAYAQPAGQHYGAPVHPNPFDADPRLTQARADVQSWDLSNYAPGQIPPGYGGHGGVHEHDARGQPLRTQDAHGGHDGQWQQPGASAHWPQGAPGHQGHDGAPQGHYQPRPGEAGYQPGGVPHDDGYDADEAMPPAEKRRGPGTLTIVGALVGAIAVGGGLAYGYKMMGGSVRDKGKPPVVKAEANPARTVPKDAGGKSIDNSNSKFLNGLASNPAPATAVANVEQGSRTGDVDGTTKKVTSIPITLNKDGTLSPQTSRPPEPVAAGGSGVPGLVIDGMSPPPGVPGGPQLRGPNGPGNASVAAVVRSVPQPPPLPPPPAVKAVTAGAAVRPVAPKVADLPLPKVIAQQPPAPAEPAGPPKTAPRTPVPKKAAAARDDLLAAQGGATAAPVTSAAPDGAVRKGSVVATGASGYVAVLASKKSRQDALNSFADLHQKFPDLLNGMTPDVREADLKDKGLWYRLIVGPPGSQQAARTLCVKLSERGMKDCWPVAY